MVNLTIPPGLDIKPFYQSRKAQILITGVVTVLALHQWPQSSDEINQLAALFATFIGAQGIADTGRAIALGNYHAAQVTADATVKAADAAAKGNPSPAGASVPATSASFLSAFTVDPSVALDPSVAAPAEPDPQIGS